MIPLGCEARSWACDRPSCEHYVPPVPGDVLRRRPVCGLVLVEEAERVGGMTQQTIGWLLGVSHTRVHQIEKKATAKLRAELERAA